MRVFPYLIGAFASLLVGLAIGWLAGSVGFGVVAAVVVFLVSAYLIWERREHGDEAGSLRSEEARVEARNAAAYSQVGHGGGYFGGGSDGGGGFGGGGDGGGGGSC